MQSTSTSHGSECMMMYAVTDTNPPTWMTRSNAVRSQTRSLTTGNAAARHGSTVTSSPSRKLRRWSWQVVAPRSGPCGWPLIIIEQAPQIPSRQSWSNAIGSSPFAMSCSFSSSRASRNDMSGDRSVSR